MLRWYPQRWRNAHGDALLGVMLDAAEAEGRKSPTPAERRSAAMHGLGARLDERFALVSAAVATAVAGIMLIAFVIGAQELSLFAQPLVPWLSALAVIALLRARAGLPDSLALVCAVVTTLAFALAFTTMLSWSLAFDAADAGDPGSWFSQSLLLWLSAAWLTGATAIALIAFGLLSTVRSHSFARLATSIIGGVIAAPFIGMSVVNPFITALVALGVLVLVVLMGTPSSPTPAHTIEPSLFSGTMPTLPALPSRVRRHTARALALLAFVVSLLGLAYALTGSSWSSVGPDSTTTMRLGIAAMTLAGAMLVAARALIASVHAPGPSRGIPLTLLALGLVLASLGIVLGTSSAPTNPASLIATVMIAAGLGSLIGFARRGTPAGRWIIGAAVALLAAPVTVWLLPGLVFLVPLFALGFAVWGTRAPRLGTHVPALATAETQRRRRPQSSVTT